MAEPTPRRHEPRLRPAPLLFEPAEAAADPEHFFDLESIADPRALLERAAERAEWTEDYAKKMVEFGRDLMRGEPAE